MSGQYRLAALCVLALLNAVILATAVAVADLTPVARVVKLVAPSVAVRAVVSGSGLPASGTSAAVPTPAGLSSALASSMALGSSGAAMYAEVVDVVTGRVLYARNANSGAMPASTNKVATSTAALEAAGPQHRITTKVVRTAGGIVLVGGGDPTLSTLANPGYPAWASLPALARQTASVLKAARTTRVRVDYDSSLYSGPVTAPGWKVSTYYSEEDVAPVSALEVDEGGVGPGGSGTEMNPPLSAAQAFVAALGRNGIRAALGSATTAPTGAAQIAAVRSPTLAELVEYALTNSDNSIAEALLRQVAIAEHAPVSFAGGARAVHQVLARLGITSGVNTVDGSGLSRDDTITPGDLARIVATDASAAHPELRTVLTGIPIAGFSGTLALRYQSGASARGRGLVRAKTGTLDGVNTLTGYVDDADGRLLSFAFMANNVANVGDALGALDDLAATLAGCGCR